ncbi:hypothetical protein TNCV_873311 [Trichonephila clavipes]|nr:hypothetical protein TNCV_873311 [Trichonephila clavipes]
MLVRLPRAPVQSGGLRRKTQLFSGTLYMAASSKTPPHQSKGPQFNTPLQVPVFPGSSLLCRHTSCEKPSDTTSFHSVLVCHRTSSQVFLGNKNQFFFYYGGKGSGGSKGESKVKIARERRVRETRTHKRVSPCQKITRVPRERETRTHLKKISPFGNQEYTTRSTMLPISLSMPTVSHLAFVQTAIIILNDSELMDMVMNNGPMSHILPDAQLRLFLNTTRMQNEFRRIQAQRQEINFTIELDQELQHSPNQKWEQLVKKRISSFRLPTCLEGRLIGVTRALSWELTSWLKDHEVLFTLDPRLDLQRNILWKSIGLIDK